MKSPIVMQQERDFSQNINATFEFVIQNFKPLLRAVVLIAGPGAVVAGVFGGLYQSNMLAFGDAPASNDLFHPFSQVFSTNYLLMAAFSLLAYVLAGCTVYAYVIEYEQEQPTQSEDGHISTEQVWARVQKKLLQYVGALILGFVLLVLGGLLFVLPAIYLMVVFSLVFVIIMAEGLSPVDALKRAFYLINGNWWAHFGLIIIVGIIQGVFGLVFQAPMLIITFLKSIGVLGGDLQYALVGSTVLSTIGSTCVNTLSWVAIAFQYYNFVERKEGRGMRQAIEAIGQKQTPPASGTQEQY